MSYSKEDYEEVMRLRKLGYGHIRIGRMTGVRPYTAYSWFAKGVKPRSAWTEEEKARWSAGCSERHTGRRHTLEAIEKMRLTKLGPLNPMWKGDEASIRTAYERAERWYGADCPKGKEIHHIDGNPYNNEPENIEFLTRKEHMIKDGRLDDLIERSKKGPSEETIKKMRMARLGKKHTEETIEKMRMIHANHPRDEKGRFLPLKSKNL